MEISILNYKYEKLGKASGYNIMRGYSSLANPYKVKPWGPYERGETLELYRDWLYNKYYIEKDQEVIKEIDSLRQKLIKERKIKLVCACFPAKCHGEIIKNLLFQLVADYIGE